MTEKFREIINADINNAANTCNAAVELMRDMDVVTVDKTIKSACAMALIGINQALIAIAETIANRGDGE